MKKLILFFILYFGFININFANTGEVEELKNQIKTLEINYQNLNTKYNSFLSGGLENYAKVVAEGKLQSDEKGKAYDLALNQIKYWFWIIAGILGLIAGILGIKTWPDIRKRIINDIKIDIAESTGSNIDNKILKFDESLKLMIDLKFSEFNEKLTYGKIKELKDILLSDSEVQIKNQTEKLFNDTIDSKLEIKVKEVLLPDNQN